MIEVIMKIDFLHQNAFIKTNRIAILCKKR